MSLRDAILNRGGDLPREVVTVPEWGHAVEVRAMSALAQGEYEDAVREWANSGSSADTVRALAALVVRVAYNPETGEPVFKLDDVDRVASAGGIDALQRIADTLHRISSFTAGDMEELVGKSAETPIGGSG